MTPADYLDSIVLPTVREFLVDRGDYRRAFLACTATYHLVDHLAHARMGPQDSSKRAARKAREAEANHIRDMLRVQGASAVDVVQGICNGTKHADPVDVRQVPVFAWDIPSAGWGEGRWDVPGLEVEQDGQGFFVDWCVQSVLLAISGSYSQWFGPVDLTFFDAVFRGQPGWSAPQ